MMDYLVYFFNPRHLFSIRPEAMEDRAIILLAGFFGALIIASLVVNLRARKGQDGLERKAYNRIFSALLTIGILGFVYLFFTWQGAALLGSRFWILVLVIILIVWLMSAIKYLIKAVPVRRQELQREKEIKKYLP